MADSIFAGSGTLSFPNGVPVGGWSNVVVYPDGRFSFSGHFHDSGITGYGVSVIWWIKSKTGTVFTFATTGSVGGSLFGGSHDWDFAMNGVNPTLAEAWGDLSAGWNGQCNARASLDLGGLWDGVKAGIGAIGPIVAVVGALA
jgi:hypothetical protein